MTEELTHDNCPPESERTGYAEGERLNRVPLFARKFVVDFVETGLAALLALELAGSPETVARSVGVALIAAGVAAGRRALPGAVAWLRESFQVPE